MAPARIHGPESNLVGFLFVRDGEQLPIIYACQQDGCPVILTMAGLRVVRAGHVTCMRCLRPMVLLAETVH